MMFVPPPPLTWTTVCKQVVNNLLYLSEESKFDLPILDEAEDLFSLLFFGACHWWGWTLVDNNAAIVDALWPIKFEGGYSGFGM